MESAKHSPLYSEQQREASRHSAGIYSKALRLLRDRHPDEFEAIYQELKGGAERKRPPAYRKGSSDS